MPAVDDLVCFALSSASRATTQAYRVLLDPFGLTYPQYIALVTLWADGEQTVKSLGEALQLDSGTLSPMLARMEAAGYVTRTRRTDDERVVTVALTARGTAMRQELSHVPRCVAAGAGFTEMNGARELIEALHRLTGSMKDLRDHPDTALASAGVGRPQP